MTETTARTRQPFDVRLTDRGADIWSGPTDNDVIFGSVYDKGPGSYDHEEMAKVWAAAYPVMFPALARIRDRARNGGKHALLDLAWIAEEAAAALPGPTIGDLNGATPPALSSPAPAVAEGWKLVPEDSLSSLIGGARLARYLIDIIEGPFGWATCRSQHGMRLKDAPEYVAAYLGIKEAFAAAEAIAAPPAPSASPAQALPYGPHDVMINGGRHSAIALMNDMDAAPPAGEGKEALEETAKRIAWAFHDRLVGIGSLQTPDGLWADSAIMTEDDKAAWIAAACAATAAPADTQEMVEALANWWMSDAPFDERLTSTNLVKSVCWDLSDEGKAALDRHYAALAAARTQEPAR